jgi:hypothetical protein
LSKPNTKNVIQRLVRERYTPIYETTGDGASNWGGWQGGMPGSGSPLKGMRGGKNDTGRIENQSQTVRRKKSAPGGTVGNLPKGNDGNIRLGPKTKVIVNPTIKQSENDIDLKNGLLTRPDNPASRGKAVRQVKESDLTENDLLAGLVAKGVNYLLRKAFGGGKKPVRKTAAPEVCSTKATNCGTTETSEPRCLPGTLQRMEAQKDCDGSDIQSSTCGWHRQ